jgi:hypothetical protein
MIAALAVLLALAVMGSLIVLRRRGGAQAASFDPVALEDAVYSELYGERTVRVLPGREARSAADGSARTGAPEDLHPEHADQPHDDEVEDHRLGRGGGDPDGGAGGVVAVVAGDQHDGA